MSGEFGGLCSRACARPQLASMHLHLLGSIRFSRLVPCAGAGVGAVIGDEALLLNVACSGSQLAGLPASRSAGRHAGTPDCQAAFETEGL